MPFTVTMPKLSPTMEEGTIAKWHKKEGDFVESGTLLLEVATDKATIEHQALDEGWLRKILVSEGQTAAINQPLAIFSETQDENIEEYLVKEMKPQETSTKEKKIETKQEKQKEVQYQPGMPQPTFIPESPPPLPVSEPKHPKLVASPLAKRIAQEQGLDLSTVKGTGPGGRITSKDLSHAQPAGLVTFGHHEEPSTSPGTYEEILLNPMRKIIARRLQESKSFVPHFYIKQTIDAEPLAAFREQLKTFGLHVTYNDLILKASALALKQHPEVNTGFHSVHQTIVQFKTIDISIAVSVEGGLITPILRHVDYKNLGEISQEARSLAERARALKLKEHEYKGGSFSVSNLGMYGITEFTAVINPPQSAILAVGGIEDQPIVKEEKVIPGKKMTLVLSVDHRVIDGALAATFMKSLQKLLENPAVLGL